MSDGPAVAEHWTVYLSAAIYVALSEARKHDVTLDRARRRIANRVEREWNRRARGDGSAAVSNRHTRRAAQRKKAAA